MKGRRISHFLGKGRLFLLMFGYESETAKHLFVSKIYVIAAQSFPFKVQTTFVLFCFVLRSERVYGALCCVLQEYGY